MSKKARKRKLENDDQSTNDCEQENIFSNELKSEIETMWEIPQIFHFFHLTKDVLNTPNMSIYELERMLAIPRASKQLANVMTCLLSSPITKAKIKKLPPMPYEFWTNILTHKVKSWFKVYHGKQNDAVKVLETIGVEPEFWNVFPDDSVLDGGDFEELTFKQRVWLLKTICDTIMHTRKTVQEEIAKQPWDNQFETVLGTDRYGAKYIYFPQFIETDIRIYRHCLDNNILSTVKPISSTVNAKPEVKLASTGTRQKTKRRRRWQNGFSGRVKKRVVKSENQFPDKTKDLKSPVLKRARTVSKNSEESAVSSDAGSSNPRSSGYNSNTSNDSKKMFKGFSDQEKPHMEENGKILNDLGKDVGEKTVEHPNERAKVEEKENSQKMIDEVEPKILSMKNGFYLNTGDMCEDSGNVETVVDNLSSSSKTDDEKLNEMIAAENSKIEVEANSRGFSEKDNLISIASKSDDEKLHETKSNNNNLEENAWHDVSVLEKVPEKLENKNRKNESFSACNSVEDSSNSKKDVSRKSTLRSNFDLNREIDTESISSNATELCSSSCQFDNYDEDSSDNKDYISDLRSRLQREIMEDSGDCSDDTNGGYNLRKSKDRKKMDSWKNEVENLNEMLIELGTSKFQLVADSVNTLKDLISYFSPQENDPQNCSSMSENIPLCEAKLTKKLTELYVSLKKQETKFKEAAKRAKAKLQRELHNFKEGSVEDQDSPGEGLSSNWWVIGSQGCPLSVSGDATLSTLPQSSVSAPGGKINDSELERENEKSSERREQNEQEARMSEERQEDQTNEKTAGNDVEKQNRENEETDENDHNSKDYDDEEQPRRVLRARGVSSYNEQLYSDEEIDENELEEWTHLEAIYAAPGTQADTSAPNSSQKAGHADGKTEEEDSDQDWILPSSRKRKNKRPSANRRLKSFQHKIQNLRTDSSQNSSNNSPSSNAKVARDKSKSRETKESHASPGASPGTSSLSNTSNIQSPDDPKETVPSDTICKIDSVHSELDIKDEGPIFDTIPQQFESNYGAQPPQNFVMLNADQSPVNYYVMQPQMNLVQQQTPVIQPGTIVSGVMPPVQQSYYVQGTQNYIIHSSQSNFSTTQPSFQQNQLISPQFVSPGYVPYVVGANQSQTNCVVAEVPRNQVVNQDARQNSRNQALRAQNRMYRPPGPRNVSNGAVIRSNAPVRGNLQRNQNPRPRNPAPQIRASAPKSQQLQQKKSESTGQKTTSLIVLSDSDDEIEMIITEKTGSEQPRPQLRKIEPRRQKPTVTSDITVATKNPIPPQIIQRMSQGGISITPVKPPPPVQNPNTQIVVVVNETGSHYALALPNGSKLILTPEQVAQIRASNGGKLIL